MRPMTRRIVIVAFPGVQALDVTGPFEVFVGASRMVAESYAVELVSVDGTMVETESGLTLGTRPLPTSIGDIDTLILPGGSGSRAARYDAQLIDWVRTAADRSRRVVTVCTG